MGPLSIQDRTIVRPEIVSELRSRNPDHLDSREITDIGCRAIHDTRTGKSPERSSNLIGDRVSSGDGPDSLDPNTSAKDRDAEHAFLPGQREREITMPCEYTQKTKYEAKPCQENVKKRKHDEKRKSRTVSTEYKARQDLDEGDADEAKFYNEYKRGELSIHGEDTYKKIKPDLKAINDFRNNTKDVNLHPTDQNREWKAPWSNSLHH